MKSLILMINAGLVILSAGQGQRMQSSFPKPLHPVGGKPLLARTLQAGQSAGFSRIFVVVKYAEQLLAPIIRAFQAESIQQGSKPGTAGSLMSVPLNQLPECTIVVNGDHPFISKEDFQNFYNQALEAQADICVGVCSISDPKNYGRIIRKGSQIEKIVESYDFTEEIESINEINTGLMMIRTQILSDQLPLITNDNPKQEYPITDLIHICSSQGLKIQPIPVDLKTAFGVNTQEELSTANNFIFEQKTQELMNKGVIFLNPGQVHIEEDVQVEQGSIIYPGVYLKGKTHIGSYCAVESNCFIYDSTVESSVYIKSHSYLEKTYIQSKSVIGPFAHLRPGSNIGKECKIGNFAEIKNSKIGDKTKAGHACYLGDAVIGSSVNIGCGTVTCNYAVDKKKHPTHISDNSFIGSGSMLVAPVEIESGAVIGAGSVITKNVPKNNLAVARAEQKQNLYRAKKTPKNGKS